MDWGDWKQTAGQHPVASGIAQALIEGFDKHYRLFRVMGRTAKARFEAADWPGQQKAVKDRIQFYDDRVQECVTRLLDEFNAEAIDDATWQQVKLLYIGLLINHRQPECAETFFNSVTTKILHRRYFHNDYVFVRPAIATDYMESDPPTYRSYYPKQQGIRASMRAMFADFGWARPFTDLERDLDWVMAAVTKKIGGLPALEANCQIQVLNSPFYRNKAAYVIGRAVNGHDTLPFAIPVLHDEAGGLKLDTVLLDAWRISILFSLSRAYFLTDMEVPSGYVQFLRHIMPNKPRSELYTMLGLAKQGKTIFHRDLAHHLYHSNDQFIEAPGIRGMVMLVFTLPSYPYVFKLIKDRFGPSKDITREGVKQKFLMVKQVDRVGRLADTLEFSDLALPRARFCPALLEELKQHTASLIEEDGDQLIIRHCYIERRMVPLNLYLDAASPAEVDEAVRDYGNAIRELAVANIFPGDMLWKNFGVTRYGRVVFYDYDEIEFLTDCRFKRIPTPPYPELEMSGEAWYPVAKNDVFPEEFRTFLLSNNTVKEAFLKYHSDLLTPEFWQQTQARVAAGHLEDFFPYPIEMRFSNTKNAPEPAGA
ncbi:MAG: hypothetical protein RIR70_559 [Pseudomonadota bacterium]